MRMSLNSRETALISIGVSVGVNCQPCLQYCVAQAREIGLTEQEIRDAVNAGKVVRSGAANKMNRYIEELLSGEPSEQETAEKGCGCGCGGAEK
jgi:AhpD family alkylhydroperoxidase